MRIFTTFLTAAAVIVLSSCEGLFNPDRAGSPIRFGATAENGMSPLTKTAYTGEVIGNRERIDWVNGDKILISMYYDNGNGGNVMTDLKQYSIVNIQPDGFKSVAQVAAVGDPLIWGSEGTYHRFVGIYPSTYGGAFSVGDRWNGSTIEFNLPDTQDGSMDYAYMAAMTGYYTPSEKATLDFYPMVTTLYFTLVNDTEDMQEVRRIELEQKNEYNSALVGSYTVATNAGGQFAPRSYGWSGSQKLTLNVNKQIQAGESFSIPTFITPLNHSAGNIYIDVIFPNKRLSNDLSNKKVSTFEACKKYNITVSLSGEGTTIDPPIDPDIPPVYPSSDGAAQLLLLLMQSSQFKEVYQELFGNNAPTGFTDFNDFWNHCYLDKFINSTFYVDDPMKHMKELFPEEIFKTLGVLCNMVTDLILPDVSSAGITKSVDAKAFKMFPNVRTISLYIDQTAVDDCSISIDGLEYLQSITIEHPRKVDIKNCGSLTNVTLKNPESRTDLNVDKATCPNYQG